MDRATRNGPVVEEEPIDGPVKVIDRRRWAHGEAAEGDAPLRRPAYVEELERQLAEKDAANKRVAAAKAAVKESTAAAEKTAAELEATNAKMQP